MNLDKRSHDFLMYMELKNHYDKLSIDDLKWIIEYLEDRLEFYCRKENKK